MKCFSCGNDKDLNVQKSYPYPEDDCLCDDPISQLLTIECQGRNNYFKMAVMCHDCWHRLQIGGGIDMWIGESCWESLNPIIHFSKLPNVLNYDEVLAYEKWKAENYEPNYD